MYKYFIMMLLAEHIASSSQIFLKMSSKKSYPSAIREYLNCLVIGGYSLLMVSMVITVFCYNKDKLGYMGTVVMEPISYIFVLILSRIVFKEKISKRKIVGMSLIICGITVFFLNKPM